MLARRRLPFRYQLFNCKWGAPSGRLIRKFVRRELRATPIGARLVGCFGFQTNNTTRAFEYPWAVEAIAARLGLRVLEIGGSLSGLQFVLDKGGCDVVNVDPGDDFYASGWPVTPATMARLNKVLGTHVELRNCFLQDAQFADASFDRVVSISVFEHLQEDVAVGLLREIRRILKPGGTFVLTVDLFLDLKPFTAVETNAFGHNMSVKWIVDASGLTLVHGIARELYGYSEFDRDAVAGAARRGEFLVGRYPAMVQTVILAKPRD